MSNVYALPFRQPIDYPLVTPSANLAVSLTNVKAWLKIPSTLTADDTLITYLIKAATGYFEKITGRDLVNKTYKTYLDSFPSVNGIYYYSGASPLLSQYQDNGIILKKSPLSSITSIKYYQDGSLVTWDSADYYTVSTDYSAIYLTDEVSFPTDIDIRRQAIVINFVAGYGVDDTYVPDDMQQAVMRFIEYLYDNRGDCSDLAKQNAAIGLFMPFKITENM